MTSDVPSAPRNPARKRTKTQPRSTPQPRRTLEVGLAGLSTAAAARRAVSQASPRTLRRSATHARLARSTRSTPPESIAQAFTQSPVGGRASAQSAQRPSPTVASHTAESSSRLMLPCFQDCELRRACRSPLLARQTWTVTPTVSICSLHHHHRTPHSATAPHWLPDAHATALASLPSPHPTAPH